MEGTHLPDSTLYPYSEHLLVSGELRDDAWPSDETVNDDNAGYEGPAY